MTRKAIDLTNKIFNNLTVIGRAKDENGKYKIKNKSSVWLCKCKCGNITEVARNNLISGNVKSCGCLNKPLDLRGKRFGKLVAIKPLPYKKETSKGILWLCKCDCGNEIEVTADKLSNNMVKSCGCLHRHNLTGKTFGKLKVIKQVKNKRSSNGKSLVWLCECSCEKHTILEVSAIDLEQGKIKSCGCIKQENINIKNRYLNNLEGKHKSRNPTGVTGVYFNQKAKDENKKCWGASITVNKHRYYLGKFYTKEEAVAARLKAEDDILKPYLQSVLNDDTLTETDSLNKLKERIKKLD